MRGRAKRSSSSSTSKPPGRYPKITQSIQDISTEEEDDDDDDDEDEDEDDDDDDNEASLEKRGNIFIYLLGSLKKNFNSKEKKRNSNLKEG